MAQLFIFFVKISHDALDFPVGVPFFDVVPAVVFVFTLGETDLNFDQSLFEIEGKGDGGITSHRQMTVERRDLSFMEQQTAHTAHIVVETVPEIVVGNVDIMEPRFAA